MNSTRKGKKLIHFAQNAVWTRVFIACYWEWCQVAYQRPEAKHVSTSAYLHAESLWGCSLCVFSCKYLDVCQEGRWPTAGYPTTPQVSVDARRSWGSQQVSIPPQHLFGLLTSSVIQSSGRALPALASLRNNEQGMDSVLYVIPQHWVLSFKDVLQKLIVALALSS